MKPFLVFLGAGILCLSGCSVVGPHSIRHNHKAFNRSVISTLNQQLLINLIRHKYRDNPYFLDIASITSSQSAGGSASSGITMNGDNPHIWTPRLSLDYEDKPTISYIPLRGKDYLKNILGPITVESMLSLTQSGWDTHRVLALCVERMNGLENAAEASGPTPEEAPVYEKFQHAIHLLDVIQKGDPKAIIPGRDLKTKKIVLQLNPSQKYGREMAELRSLWGVPHNVNMLTFSSDELGQKPNDLVLRTRSISGMLFFLSQNIEVPKPHVEQGLVTVTRNPDGTPFDWNAVSGDFLKVRSSLAPPSNAFVSVPYRGWWFYIADNDLSSKSTFMLLSQLFNLQAGQVKTVSPTLTIPVGG